jgi:hypothetical protein
LKAEEEARIKTEEKARIAAAQAKIDEIDRINNLGDVEDRAFEVLKNLGMLEF